MTDDGYQLYQLLKRDPRFTFEAYQFVRESLGYAQDVLKFGKESFGPGGKPGARSAGERERHLTGPQLCEAVRIYALGQYGYMARAVLKSWGLESTGNIGDIVYNLIEIGWMKKSATDRREDFDNVYDFAEVFENDFEISSID